MSKHDDTVISSIRRAYWEDHMRRTAQQLCVQHPFMPVTQCVTRAVDLANKVEAAIHQRFMPTEHSSPTHGIDLSDGDALADSDDFGYSEESGAIDGKRTG